MAFGTLHQGGAIERTAIVHAEHESVVPGEPPQMGGEIPTKCRVYRHRTLATGLRRDFALERVPTVADIDNPTLQVDVFDPQCHQLSPAQPCEHRRGPQGSLVLG